MVFQIFLILFLIFFFEGREGQTEIEAPINIFNNINNDSMMSGTFDVIDI